MICQRQCGWLQVQTQLTGRMALFEEKAGETLRLSAQVEQLTHQLNRQEQETAQAAASAAAAAAQVHLCQYVHQYRCPSIFVFLPCGSTAAAILMSHC